MNFQQPVVTIPNLTHTTIEQILSINAHIIKILCQYQNYGWLEEPEYKIYQARLQANLTYLATAADYMGKPDPAKLALLINPPNLAAVGYPEKLKQQKKAAMSEAGSNSGSSSRLNTGITMAMDPNIGDVTGKF
ncbi:hypothetical protein BDR26DRAFT_858860 [Obelidium mucronatum]|nr:hypothetical protein BDR26DRAFT_858860 [Obelidium mucronatum]